MTKRIFVVLLVSILGLTSAISINAGLLVALPVFIATIILLLDDDEN